MCVAGQSVFLVRRILIRRKGFVPKAIFCTIMNVTRKILALIQHMMDNRARIYIPGA